MRRLARYFLNGLLVTAPLALTIYVVVRLLRWVDGWLALPIPGLGFLITLLLITLIGFLASNLLWRTLFGYVEQLLAKLPFVRLLYTALRDVMGAFVGEQKRFDKPVLVTLDAATQHKAVGFLTKESLDGLGIAGHVAVYFPQSYNFAGQLLVVPADRVTPLTAPSAEVMAFVVSGGVTAVGQGGEGRKPATGP